MAKAHFQPAQYLTVPAATSESWQYLPVDFMPADRVAAHSLMVVRDARLYHFGILSSAMHMAWVKFTTGKLDGSHRHADKAILKNFPWPLNHTEAQLKHIEAKAQAVLDARDAFLAQPLEALYDPLTMPDSLRDAHEALDAAVDAAYGRRRFDSDLSRIGFLLSFDRQITALLVTGIEERAYVHSYDAMPDYDTQHAITQA